MICSTFMSRSLFRCNDKGAARLLRHLPAVSRRAAAHAFDGLGHSALVHAQTAVDPVQLRATGTRLIHELRDPLFGERMVLLRRVAAVNGIGVRGLPRERKRNGTFVSEHIHVVTAAKRSMQKPESGRSARALK